MGSKLSLLTRKLFKRVPREETETDNDFLYFKFFSKFYKISDWLGGGIHGTVYKVTHCIDDGEFALKIVEIERRLNNAGGETKAKQEAAREIHCLREADHPNILRYYFAWEIDKLPSNFKKPDINFPNYLPLYCIQTELCDSTLRKKLCDKATTNREQWIEESMKFVEALADGIRYIHELKIMHRDLNSDNIFLKRNVYGQDILKIGDFGMSRTYRPEQTLTRSVEGTTLYRSMEQNEKTPYTLKCDVYSMAVLLYEMLHPSTLIPASSAKPVEKCMKNLCFVHDDPSKYEDIPDIPTGMNDLMKRMLQREVNRPSAQEVWKDLKAINSSI